MRNQNHFKKGTLVALAAAVTMLASLPMTPVAGVLPSLGITASAADSIAIVRSAGYEEGAFVEWNPISSADGYNVYCNGVQLDSMLIRQFKDGHLRADAVGLKPGSYKMKIVAVSGGKELSTSVETSSLTVVAHDRTGFAFDGTDGSCGAYKADGTLKDNAVVLYVTESTKNTVSLDVVTSSKGATTPSVGIQNILTSYQKGYDNRPLDIRFVGKVTDPSTLVDGDLLVKGNGDTKRLSCGVTIEGIGEDATVVGFGLRLANCSGVEIRNVGVMLVDSGEGDNYTLQQSCDHVWIHHCDSFYGMAGGDSDQAKGDGAMDCKKSSYITFSYNHFYDNGKCCLLGLSEGTVDDLYITYHHNWFDHSDSRHPRIRFYSAHVYNNYYDGNAKYGIGSTNGSSVFAESNYFRNCKFPMLTSMQGSDVISDWASLTRDEKNLGTFSSEDGGVIKAYGNVMEGQKTFVSYQENSKEYDAYVVTNKTDKVPSSVLPYQTSKLSVDHTYNNFDTSSKMYKYTADNAADVPAKVMANAGRLNGGDFQWKFNNSVDDASYSVNQELMAALKGYTSQTVKIGSGFSGEGGATPGTTPTATTPAVTTTTTSTTKAPTTTTKAPGTTKPDVVTDGDIFVSPTGKGSGKTQSDPTDIYTAVKSLTPGHTIYLLGGTYDLAEQILIEDTNNGTASAMKTIKPYQGANVVFDFSSQGPANSSIRGIVLDGDYWHFYGFEITKAADNGMLLGGSNNTIEMMVFNDNQDTGLQISRYKTSNATVETWPSNNLILNCTSKNNCDDVSMENADGFAAKLTCGEGNVFDGCMAYNNSDDGWDLFAKTETGPIGVVTLRNCLAFRNGFTEFGEGYGDCDGNGFKLGGSGVGSAHVVENCLAFENLHCGFTDNNNPKLGSLTNCTSFNNNMEGTGKPNFSLYRCTDDGCDFKNMMSVYDASLALSDSKLKAAASNDKYVGTYENGVYYNSAYYEVGAKVTATNGMKLGTKLSAAPASSEFISYTKAPAQGTDFHTAWRNADGTINNGGLYETTSSSKYATMGYHMYNGTTPVIPPATTTVTTEKPASGTTTTVTTKGGSETPAGAEIHDFTANGTNSSFYTITGNLSTSKGTVTYAGKTLTQCLKMESATNIKFNAPSAGKLTLVFVEPAATIKVDGTKYTASGDGIITVDVAAGSHEVVKADSANLFYMVYAGGSSTPTTTVTDPVVTTTYVMPTETTVTTTYVMPTETTTTATTPAPGGEVNVKYGDINSDGMVDLSDAVLLSKYLAKTATLSQNALAAADVNESGMVDDADLAILLKFIVVLIDKLPYLG